MRASLLSCAVFCIIGCDDSGTSSSRSNPNAGFLGATTGSGSKKLSGRASGLGKKSEIRRSVREVPMDFSESGRSHASDNSSDNSGAAGAINWSKSTRTRRLERVVIGPHVDTRGLEYFIDPNKPISTPVDNFDPDFANRFNKMKRMLSAVLISDPNKTCALNNIFLDTDKGTLKVRESGGALGSEHRVEFKAKSFAKGSSSLLFLSKDAIYKPEKAHLAYKLLLSTKPQLVEGMHLDKVFMTIFHGLSIAPTLYKITSMTDASGKDIRAECEPFTMVSEVVGSHELRHYDPEKGNSFEALDTRSIALVAAKLIALIKKIHEKGMLHGDVHARNIVFMDVHEPMRVHESLHFIDFGRSEPFIDEQGKHVPKSKHSYGSGWSPKLLSVFELKRSRKSRRDDMYRLGELILHLHQAREVVPHGPVNCGSHPKDPPPNDPLVITRGMCQQLDRKSRRIFDGVPEIFIQFYEEAERMKFADRPRYEVWIQAFTNYANKKAFEP